LSNVVDLRPAVVFALLAGRSEELLRSPEVEKFFNSLAICKRRSRSAALAEVRSADPEV
jgi:hypothetical protein